MDATIDNFTAVLAVTSLLNVTGSTESSTIAPENITALVGAGVGIGVGVGLGSADGAPDAPVLGVFG